MDDGGTNHTLPVNTTKRVIDADVDVSNYEYIILNLGNTVINAGTGKTMNVTISIVN